MLTKPMAGRTSACAASIDRRTAMRGAGGLLALSMFATGDATAQEGGSPPAHPARMIDGRTLTATIADYAAGTSSAKLPPEVLERTKKVVFDEMACSYFGRRSPRRGSRRALCRRLRRA